MSVFGRTLLAAGLSLLLVGAIGMTASSPGAREVEEIEAFNERFEEVTLRVNNAGVIALWADDGVTLLPGMAPIEGKKTIARWLDEVVAKLPGYKATKQENEFHDIRVTGDWASEWGTTHQAVNRRTGSHRLKGMEKFCWYCIKTRAASGGWRQRRPGSDSQSKWKKEKRTGLTHTGHLMKGVSPPLLGLIIGGRRFIDSYLPNGWTGYTRVGRVGTLLPHKDPPAARIKYSRFRRFVPSRTQFF
jgi:ketosteroid isomerase-like protein